MPVKETPNTVTVGQICKTCGLFAIQTCPYGNHTKNSVLEYSGDIRGKCTHFAPIAEAKTIIMKKNAEKNDITQLNIALYREIYCMKDSERRKFIKYWESIFPKEYAEDMGTDKNESIPHNLKKKKEKRK